MFENATSRNTLKLTTLSIPPPLIYPVFVFGTLIYLFIVVCNLLVFLTIAMSKRLHKPMFLLLINLPVIDLLGTTAFFPQLVISIVTQSRLISYPACVTQSFFIHLYGMGNVFILNAMAYDRYFAICLPLKYHAIMSPRTLTRIILLVWFINFSELVTIFTLTLRFKLCRTDIMDLYCNNPAMLQMICSDITLNVYFGTVLTFLTMGGSMLTLLFTYARILFTCVITSSKDARKKALQTCGTHLVVFLFLLINTLLAIFSDRFVALSPPVRRGIRVSILVFPPLLDPIIYGLNTKELKQSMKILLKRNVGSK